MSTESKIKIATASEEITAAQEIRRKVFIDEQGIHISNFVEIQVITSFPTICLTKDSVT